MSDGSVRETVEGLTISSKEFYIIFNQLRSKRNEKENTAENGTVTVAVG